MGSERAEQWLKQRQQPTDRNRSPQDECIRNKPTRDRSRSASPRGEAARELEEMQHEQKETREAVAFVEAQRNQRKLAEAEEAEEAWKLLDQEQNVTKVAEEART